MVPDPPDLPDLPVAGRRKVTMRRTITAADGVVYHHEAIDYVPVPWLDVYVADARTRWDTVDVGTKHDPGPGGDTAPAVLPEHLRNRIT